MLLNDINDYQLMPPFLQITPKSKQLWTKTNTSVEERYNKTWMQPKINLQDYIDSDMQKGTVR